MVKNAGLPYQIFTNASMSGTITVSGPITDLMYKDSAAVSLNWSGTPTGTFFVNGSVDYNPGLPQSDGTINNGTFTTLALSPAPVATGSGGSSQILINMSPLAFRYMQISYTNSTGSGLLTGWICSKSYA